MSGQNDLTTTVPKITLADISDPTLHRLNLILERLFGLVAVTDQKASDLGRKIYRAEGVSVNAGYTPPTPGGEAPVWSPLDPPEVPTGITAALVTDPGGDRFGFRTTWSAPSPPGGTVKYDVWCKFYGYDEAESGWTYDEGSEESDFIRSVERTNCSWRAGTGRCRTTRSGSRSGFALSTASMRRQRGLRRLTLRLGTLRSAHRQLPRPHRTRQRQ